ncbi:MAG TPA: PLP-dependent aminotransferase family protein [Bryobacteraceae bacterium]|jgi:GntR family transcriptional regulator/MocR family aminotransferase|nr:PLP-dependent aminotransferase family protein [Bryobacteraceae bacterium]
MEFHVNLLDRKDLSGEIYRQLRRAILDGRLRPGELLPPTRELARRLSVARTTATVAYDRLSGEGFVVSRVGAGTFVTEHAAPLTMESARRRSDGALRPRAVWNYIPLATAFARRAQFDFRTGLPDASLFPHDRWRRLVSTALRSEAVETGVYGDPAGYQPLRVAIARYLGSARGMQITADDVTIVNGTQQGLDVVARTLIAPGDKIAVEDPGYPLVRRLLESLGARVRSASVDDNGLIVETLPARARLVYVTPSHQYPLGMSMSLPRRRALLEWAERNDSAIIEDDYDSEFRFRDRPIEPLQTLDTTGRVIYIGSFSKTILPTLRLGFVVTPPSLRAAVHRVKQLTDWHTSMPLQVALTQFIESGDFARHIRKMREAYRVRHEMVRDVLSQKFADHLQLIPSIAGLHVAAFARTASVEAISAIARKASEAGVEIQELSTFTLAKQKRAGVVLGYGAIPTSKIKEGLRRLRHCFDEQMS